MDTNQLDIMTLSKEQLKEALKIMRRIKKYGDPTVVQKRGPKPVSAEHKKEVWKAWYAKQKEIKKEAGITVYAKKGRPFKNPVELN